MLRHFLFSTTSGYGHYHPLVPLAKALREAGHHVAFAARPPLQARIEALGFAFFPVGGELDTDPQYQEIKAQLQTMPMNLETELFSYPRLFCGVATRLRTPELVAIAKRWKPDMLIREAAEYCALIAAEHLGLPHATVAIAAAVKGFSLFEREAAVQLDSIRQSWSLPPDPTLTSLYRYLHLAYSPPAFAMQDVGGPEIKSTPGFIPTTTHFIRPDFFDNASDESLPDWLAQLPSTGKPTVYVTLGTEVNKEPEFYPGVLQTIIEGLRDMPINLIVTLGRDNDPADFGLQPANVHVERYIPQSLLLRQCDLIVMHGGSNTLLQALDAGLPMVVVPLIADQFFNAQVAQSLQVGQVVQRNQLTATTIRASVEAVLNNPDYRRNTRRLQTEMQALPDQSYAVELIERVIATHTAVLNTDLITALGLG